MNRKILDPIKFAFLSLLWMGVIFYLSSIPDLRVGSATVFWEIIWRKLAHVGEYVILTWLLMAFFCKGLRMNFKRALVFVFGLVFIYSIGDEIHQLFVAGRTGRAIDVLVDILGAFLGAELLLLFFKISKIKVLAMTIVTALIITGIIYKMERNSIADQVEGAASVSSLQISDNIQEESVQASFDNKNETTDKILSLTLENNLPEKIMTDVPFTSQAPLKKWDAIHEEACEEASLVMLKYYLDNKQLSSIAAEREIQRLVDFEVKNYGSYKDSTAEQIVTMASDYYGIKNLKVVYDFKPEDIKVYLAKGEPIILPAAGRELGNPNFKSPGPLYHNLVLTGYNGNRVITNDPGTKNGAGYVYDLKTLYNATHDFPGRPENISQGRKAMIVVE